VVTAAILRHPEFALRTLLIFLSLHVTHKLVILFTRRRIDRVLLTSLQLMPINPAIQTVRLFAFRTLEKGPIALLEEEHVPAGRRWTPRTKLNLSYIESPCTPA
jgi:hypothetical protein